MDYVHLSACSFHCAHKYMLIYESVQMWCHASVCVCVSMFLCGLILHVKKLQMLYEVRMEQLNKHRGG